MDKQTFLGDIQRYLATNGLTPHRFAKICGVDVASFFRFIRNPERTLQSDAVFRIWTVIYGGRKPQILSRAQPLPQTDHAKGAEANGRPATDDLPF